MIPLYQVDAFTKKKYKGNPAGVCLLEKWLDDNELQAIATEMNLSETAFLVKGEQSDYHLRWFTPNTEVRLCGHATLASAHVLFAEMGFDKEEIIFSTQEAGELRVLKMSHSYQMNFPLDKSNKLKTQEFENLINQKIHKAYKGTDDLLLIVKDQSAVKECMPNLVEMKKHNFRAVIISSVGDKRDFVSRVFAPNCGIDEDPVTGSAHTLLAEYWSKVLGKTEMLASQLSDRNGELKCIIKGDRVLIEGNAITVIKGELI